nr:transglycosylase SLT domain-containing protein [Longimicrobium terrae]
MVYDAAAEAGLDPELGFRLIRVESVFDPRAVGQGGAAGLVQMMPGTARALDPEIDTTRELMDPHTNLRLGFRLLRENILRYQKQGDDAVRLGVIAYNRGENSVDRALRRGRDPENGYGKRVLGPIHHGGKPYQGTGLRPKE